MTNKLLPKTRTWYHHPLCVSLLLLLVSISGVLLPQHAAASDQAVQPTHAAPGSVFAFFATGFAPNEEVYVWANDPTGKVYAGSSVRSNHLTRADWTWASPADAMVGRWAMVAHGSKSQLERVLFFEINTTPTGQTTNIPAGQEPYGQAITPRVAAPGTRFALFATGFHNYESVVFFAYDPTGVVFEIGAFGTNDLGRVDWAWQSPTTMVPGQWTIVARGRQSHVERVVTVTIEIPKNYPELAAPIDTFDQAVHPQSAPPGTRFFFFATNFADGEHMTYTIVAPDGTIAHRGESRAVTDWKRVDWQWDSPNDAMPGTWHTIAQGTNSGIERNIPFDIYRYEAEPHYPTQKRPYDSAVFPAKGHPGTEFAFFATGYGNEEIVAYECVAPDGTLSTAGHVRSSEFGRADWTCESPYTAPSGEWHTVATGNDTRVERIIRFEVGY